MPTLLILVIGLVIMILVIPYAFRLVTVIKLVVIIIKLVVISNTFSSVFKQLAQEREMNRVGIVTFFRNILSYRLLPYLNIVYTPSP